MRKNDGLRQEPALIACLMLIATVVSGCITASVTSISSFTSTDGRFSVVVPGGKMEEQTSSGSGHYAGATVHSFIHDEPDGLRFALFYADATDGYPTTTSSADALTAVEQADIGATKGTQVSDRDLAIAGYPGREQFINGPSGSYVFRIVFVGIRGYLFSVKGTEAEVHEAMVIVYLDSFTPTR